MASERVLAASKEPREAFSIATGRSSDEVRRLSMLGLCLVAASAILAVATATASAALPEWGKCVKFINQHGIPVGKFADAACTKQTEVPKTGEFEWMKAPGSIPNPEFTSSGGVTELQADGISTVCKGGETATGALSGNKEVSDVEVIFENCGTEFGHLVCGNGIGPPLGEEPEGQIRTRRLKGRLGFISGKGTETPSVGLVLEPEELHGLFAEFLCGPLVIRVGQFPGFNGPKPEKAGEGGNTLIGTITPVDEMAASQVQAYKTHEEEKGIQEPSALEGGPPDYLETEVSDGFATIPKLRSAQVLTTINKLKDGSKIEVRAFCTPSC